ncbi:hypothetical protein D3C79_744310 [compost metagenome]
MGQPGLRAQHLVGTGDLVHGPVDERADRIVMLAVGGLARQQRAMYRGIDDQPGALVVGIAQHQGEEAGGEALAQDVQQTGPGRRLQRAVIDQPEQAAELGRGNVEAGVQVRAGRKGQGHARLFGCVLLWLEYRPGSGRQNRPFGLDGRALMSAAHAPGCNAAPGRRYNASRASTMRSAAASAVSCWVSIWISGATGGS